MDKDGELWSASEQNEQLLVRDELRLGESEYAASAFRLWGFPAGKAFSPPSQNVIMYQRSLAVDARDPRTTAAIAALHPPAMLRVWSLAGRPRSGRRYSKGCAPGPKEYGSAKNALGARRHTHRTRRFLPLSGAMARRGHRLGNGYARNTLGDDGKAIPGWHR